MIRLLLIAIWFESHRYLEQQKLFYCQTNRLKNNLEMTLSKFNKAVCIYLFLVMAIVACTTTVTKTKNPVFLLEMDSIQTDLAKIVTCENINLDGEEVNTNGRVTTALEVDILNGKNIPGNDSEMKALGKSIASDLKRALKDKNEYDTYKVLFITKETTGDVTRRNWIGSVFKSEEL
jgi:hypothetical protein